MQYFDLYGFAYSEKDRVKFRNGKLHRIWGKKYPLIFDDDDVKWAGSISGNGRLFFEWWTAIQIFEQSGYLSLVTRYQVMTQTRKYEKAHSIIPIKIHGLLFERNGFGRKQLGPDLLCYRENPLDWFFCEIKSPTDRFRENQSAYFEALAKASKRNLRIAKYTRV